jgi:hypothetical protein
MAGIRGIFFDYPENTAWAYEGGFEDKHATTALAYRNMFQLAKDGLGEGALLQERNIVRGSDVTLGIVSSQRIWADTDGITPEMVSYCGLRWYKNRVVINYDMDSKDPSDVLPKKYSDGNRSMLTMSYVTSGRFLLGRSFAQLSKQQVQDISRVFPYHTTLQSARPIDAFDSGVVIPRIYDFAINPSWHQLTFYNYNTDTTAGNTAIVAWLSKSLNEGGLGLDANNPYYVYDFWNNTCVGLISGANKLEQVVRPGEARMMSVHAKEEYPQFISTNRHIMQGYVDMKECKWIDRKKTLQGISEVVEGDEYRIVIATNGYTAAGCNISTGRCAVKSRTDGLAELIINVNKNSAVTWKVKFK